METIDILRGMGVSDERLRQYKEMHIKVIRAFTVIMVAGIILVPLLMIPYYFEMHGNYSLFLTSLYLWVIPVALAGGYFQFVLLKINREYGKLIEKIWIIWPSGHILGEKKILFLFNIGIIEGFLLIIYLAYVAGGYLFMIFAILFLILLPAVNYAAKEKVGYTVKHLFKGDVDEITDKLTISLSGKKKLLIKSQSSRRYMVEFQNPSNFKLFVSRRPDRKEFTEVSIMGVKMENISEARRLISQIEESIG